MGNNGIALSSAEVSGAKDDYRHIARWSGMLMAAFNWQGITS